MSESFKSAMTLARMIMAEGDMPLLDRLQDAHDHELEQVRKSRFHEGYEDGRRSMDAEHYAVALRLRQLRFDEGSHENLHKVAYAIYPCATGWTCESSRGLRDELVRLLGGVSDEPTLNLTRTSAEPHGEITITAELRKWASDNTIKDMVLTTYPEQHGVHGILEQLIAIADRIDERARLKDMKADTCRFYANQMRDERDELQAKLDEAEFAIANWREREKSFDASERLREELRMERDELLAEALLWSEKSKRVAHHVGWLKGFSSTIWALVGEHLADETAAEYDRIAGELQETLLGKEGE